LPVTAVNEPSDNDGSFTISTATRRRRIRMVSLLSPPIASHLARNRRQQLSSAPSTTLSLRTIQQQLEEPLLTSSPESLPKVKRLRRNNCYHGIPESPTTRSQLFRRRVIVSPIIVVQRRQTVTSTSSLGIPATEQPSGPQSTSSRDSLPSSHGDQERDHDIIPMRLNFDSCGDDDDADTSQNLGDKNGENIEIGPNILQQSKAREGMGVN
jgi:hypothetical protein